MKMAEIKKGHAYVGKGKSRRSIRVVEAISWAYVSYSTRANPNSTTVIFIDQFAKWAHTEYKEDGKK
jgi:hypothetical protein